MTHTRRIVDLCSGSGALLAALNEEIARQDRKHGPFEGTMLGRSRLALACLEDEIAEAKEEWRGECKAATWTRTREEVLQVGAVAIRTLRDALPDPRCSADDTH